LFGPYENFNGYGAIVDTPLNGQVEFGIISVEKGCMVTGMSFKIANTFSVSANVESDRKTNEYTADGGAYIDDKDIELEFASWNENPTGSAFVLQPSGEYLQEIQYDGTYARPEQLLADRVAGFGQRTRRLLTVDIKTKGTSPTNPRQVVLNEFEHRLQPLTVSDTRKAAAALIYSLLIDMQQLVPCDILNLTHLLPALRFSVLLDSQAMP
jgi:hypothetical protein